MTFITHTAVKAFCQPIRDVHVGQLRTCHTSCAWISLAVSVYTVPWKTPVKQQHFINMLLLSLYLKKNEWLVLPAEHIGQHSPLISYSALPHALQSIIVLSFISADQVMINGLHIRMTGTTCRRETVFRTIYWKRQKESLAIGGNIRLLLNEPRFLTKYKIVKTHIRYFMAFDLGATPPTSCWKGTSELVIIQAIIRSVLHKG